MKSNQESLYKLIFQVTVLGFAIYALVFIFKTSFVLDGERYFCLFDDAMVSMRYAKNLASGAGLVWNHGERIEGYTNLLWTLYMSLFHIVKVPASKISLLIQLTGMLCLLANLLLVKKLAESIPGVTRLTVVVAVFLSAFYYPLVNWSLQGMEVGPLTLIVTATILLCLRTLKYSRISRWLYVLPSIAVFIRIDMVVFFMVIVLLMVSIGTKNRKKHFLVGTLMLAGSMLLLTTFRQLYYGELLPNTYYLKMAGYPLYLRVARGLLVFFRFAAWANWAFLLPLLLIFRPMNRYLAFLLLPFAAQVLYSIYVGGDSWERWTGCNRYICIAMPCFFIMVSLSLSQFLTVCSSRIQFSLRPTGMYCHRVLSVIIIFAITMQFNMLHGPGALGKWLLLRPPMYVNNNKDEVQMAKQLENSTVSSTKIAVVMAGVLPYFCDRYMIDMLGKNDKTIARQTMKKSEDNWHYNKLFFPGHMKWDYQHSIGHLKPDVITALWWKSEDAASVLGNYSLKHIGNKAVYIRDTINNNY